MDTEGVIKPEDIAVTIRSDEVSPHVDTSYFNPGDREDKERTDAWVRLYLPEDASNIEGNYYSSLQITDRLYIGLPDAIKESKPYLHLINVEDLTEPEQKAHQALMQLASDGDGDFSEVDFQELLNILVKIKKELQERPNADASAFTDAMGTIYRRSYFLDSGKKSRETYEELARATLQFKSEDQDSEAFSELSYEDRVVMHERTHLIDSQANAGRLIDCLRRYDALCLQKKEEDALPAEMLTARRLRGLIHDALEARAYVSECTGTMVRGNPDNAKRYSHTALSQRLLSLVYSTLYYPEAHFNKSFIRNTPVGIKGTGAIHEEHNGGSLLIAFLDRLDTSKILEDLSYESLIDLEESTDDDPHRTAVVQKVTELIQDPVLAQARLEESWVPLGELFESLVLRFDEELTKVESTKNEAPTISETNP